MASIEGLLIIRPSTPRAFNNKLYILATYKLHAITITTTKYNNLMG